MQASIGAAAGTISSDVGAYQATSRSAPIASRKRGWREAYHPQSASEWRRLLNQPGLPPEISTVYPGVPFYKLDLDGTERDSGKVDPSRDATRLPRAPSAASFSDRSPSSEYTET
jgi:hypothetical protein